MRTLSWDLVYTSDLLSQGHGAYRVIRIVGGLAQWRLNLLKLSGVAR